MVIGSNDKKIIELQDKLYTIKQLKDMIKNNISGEDQTQRTYADQMRTAQKVGKASIEFILKDISIQESKHAELFKRVISELEQEESKITTELKRKEIEMKKEDEDRRKREDEHRRAPLSEGYHGPYQLRGMKGLKKTASPPEWPEKYWKAR